MRGLRLRISTGREFRPRNAPNSPGTPAYIFRLNQRSEDSQEPGWAFLRLFRVRLASSPRCAARFHRQPVAVRDRGNLAHVVRCGDGRSAGDHEEQFHWYLTAAKPIQRTGRTHWQASSGRDSDTRRRTAEATQPRCTSPANRDIQPVCAAKGFHTVRNVRETGGDME